jgi:hypothetical protein
MQSWYTSRHSKDGTCFWDWQSRYRARQSFMHCDCFAVCAASIIDPRCESTGPRSQAPTEVTAKVPIIAPSATTPISNRDTFTPSLSERSYYHRGVCAWKLLVLRCSLLRQPAGQVRFGPKVVLTRLRSEGMIALNDRRVEFLDLKAMALLAQFQPVRPARILLPNHAELV